MKSLILIALSRKTLRIPDIIVFQLTDGVPMLVKSYSTSALNTIPSMSTLQSQLRPFKSAIDLCSIESGVKGYLSPSRGPIKAMASKKDTTLLRSESLSSNPEGWRTATALNPSEIKGLSMQILRSQTRTNAGYASAFIASGNHECLEETGCLLDEILPIILEGINFGTIHIDRVAMRISIMIKASIDAEQILFNALSLGEFKNLEFSSRCGLEGGAFEMAEKLYPLIAGTLMGHFRDFIALNTDHFEIMLFGHSLGGAIGQLIALRFYFDPVYNFVRRGGASNALNQIKVIAFAAPKVFSNEISINEFPLGKANLLKIYHKYDPIPRLPALFKDFGTSLVLNSQKSALKVKGAARFAAFNAEKWSMMYHLIETIDNDLLVGLAHSLQNLL